MSYRKDLQTITETASIVWPTGEESFDKYKDALDTVLNHHLGYAYSSASLSYCETERVFSLSIKLNIRREILDIGTVNGQFCYNERIDPLDAFMLDKIKAMASKIELVKLSIGSF